MSVTTFVLRFKPEKSGYVEIGVGEMCSLTVTENLPNTIIRAAICHSSPVSSGKPLGNRVPKHRRSPSS
ncbi:hypothetical protein M0802_008125 [Mischocyttarus mexicanus]|nr:hypothetical protein M0802_008125 [Mischocyttarus mexicanus]